MLHESSVNYVAIYLFWTIKNFTLLIIKISRECSDMEKLTNG